MATSGRTVGGQVGGGHGHAADVAAGQLERLGAEVQVEVVARGTPRPGTGPTSARRRSTSGGGEVDDEVEAAGEGLVDVGPQVGGQDGDAVERLHPLQQVGHFDVGVTVVGVLHL